MQFSYEAFRMNRGGQFVTAPEIPNGKGKGSKTAKKKNPKVSKGKSWKAGKKKKYSK